MRRKKALLNTITSITLELVTVISGFILPQLILSRFGSNYNGLVSSISQFIGYVGLLNAGIGGVTRASLYGPLEKKDDYEVSAILRATEIFMRKIATIFVIGLLIFASTYPFLVIDEFDWLFTFSLVIVLGLGTFVQYYFGITYLILLQADQKQYITIIVQILTTIINTIISVILINNGATIHIVRLGSSLIYMLNPIIIYLYVRRKYVIINDVTPNVSAIKHRWDAFAHQIADFIHNNTDLVLLSFFSNIREISVYTIYYLISSGVKKLIISISTGVEAAFGNMIAKDEHEILNKNLRIFEFLTYSISIIMLTSMSILIVPFVSVYTKGITDADYFRPTLGYLFGAVEFFYCIRIPYQAVVRASGHFKQTRNGAIFEAILNLGISLVLVNSFGILGVIIGTLCAMIFRTIQYALYVSKKIINRDIFDVIKRLITSAINIAVIMFIFHYFKLPKVNTYFEWIANALLVFSASLIITGVFSAMFHRKDVAGLLKLIEGIREKKYSGKK